MSTLVATPHLPDGARVTKRGATFGGGIVRVDTSESPPQWSLAFMRHAAKALRGQGYDAKTRAGVVTVTAR